MRTRGTISATVPFGQHSDSGSADSPQTLRELTEQGLVPAQKARMDQGVIDRHLLPPHKLPRHMALRDAGAFSFG